MVITQAFLTKGKEHGRTGKIIVPKGIVVHYVGNPGTSAAANRSWFENGSSGTGVSCHYIVGIKGEVLQLVPDNEEAQHAGKSYGRQWDEQSKKNNSTLIGIECCHPDKTGKFNSLTLKSLKELVSLICAKHGFDIRADVFRHYDVTGKNCPAYYVENPEEWEKFKLSVLYAQTDSISILEANGIISSPEYWRTNAVPGRVCKGEFVGALLDKAAKFLNQYRYPD